MSVLAQTQDFAAYLDVNEHEPQGQQCPFPLPEIPRIYQRYSHREGSVWPRTPQTRSVRKLASPERERPDCGQDAQSGSYACTVHIFTLVQDGAGDGQRGPRMVDAYDRDDARYQRAALSKVNGHSAPTRNM